MSTIVSRPAAPTVRSDTFADLPGVEVVVIRATEVEFAGDLDAATVAAIRELMITTGPVERAARAALRVDRDALAAGDPLRRLYDYVLGDGT